MVTERGRVMQFWGGIIVKAPEYIAELPKDIVALEWGYEADHPFDRNCAAFAGRGIPFYVCPGLKHGAVGYLNTIWGDRGHQDYEPVTYLLIACAAAVSWAVGKTLRNAAVPGAVLHQGCAQSRAIDGVTHAGLDNSARVVRELAARLGALALTAPEATLVQRELHNGVRMLLHGAEFGKLKLDLVAGAHPGRIRQAAGLKWRHGRGKAPPPMRARGIGSRHYEVISQFVATRKGGRL